MKATMRTSATSTAVALLLALEQSKGFAPLRPGVQSRSMVMPSIVQRRMVMGRPDPFDIMDADVESRDMSHAMRKKSTDPNPFFVDLFQKTMQNSGTEQSMKFMAAALAMALVLCPMPSEAAMSGGRMGGSYSRPAQSRSMPSRGSYSRGYSSGYGGGYYSRPNVIVTPGVGFGYNPFISPFTPFSPFPGYYGGGGVIGYSRGPNLFNLLFLGGFLFAASSVVRGITSGPSASVSSPMFGSSVSSALGTGTSVVQLSVALEVPNRDDPNSILSVLNQLSRTSKTDSRVGIQNLTSQVALELLRRRSSIVSASSSYDHYRDSNKAGREYEAKAIRERSKFEKESVSKYGGVDYSVNKDPSIPGGVDGKATMAVVTMVMAIDGDSTKVPRINSVADVEEALRRIASDAKVNDCLQSVEILWTPEDRTEVLSMRDVIADYPELRSV